MSRIEDKDGSGVPFEVHVDEQGDGVLIGLSGELESASRETFGEAMRGLEDCHPARVWVDLSGLQFVDSSGLFMLMDLWKRFSDRGADVHFEGASENVQRAIRATGLHHVLPLVGPPGASTDAPGERELLSPPHPREMGAPHAGVPPSLGGPRRRH